MNSVVVALLERIARAVETPGHLDTPSWELETISAVNSVNLHDLQVKRPSAKLQKALDWLRDNPGHLDTPSRELEVELELSHMTIYKAQQIMKGLG